MMILASSDVNFDYLYGTSLIFYSLNENNIIRQYLAAFPKMWF